MASNAILNNLGSRANYGKRITSHIAYALVLYTLMLIFMVTPALDAGSMAIWPYFLLVALVGAVILPCRSLEKRWHKIDQSYPNGGQDARFGFEKILLWLAAIGLPLALMAIFKSV